jgi:peptide/nickel transport system substrate-binding protein
MLTHPIVSEKMQIKIRVMLAGAFALLLTVLMGCANLPASESLPHRLVYGLSTLPAGIDPHINSEYVLGIPLRQVYDTLVYRNPDTREFVSGLAQSWEVSIDELIYTFHLKPNVMFHDGTPFNAQAVVANLDRISSTSTASGRALALLGSYTNYNIVDELTIQLILSVPYAPFLDGLSQVYLGIASPTALAQYSRNRYQFHQVGTGPFRFKEYVPGDRIVLERNHDYSWGPDFYRAAEVDSVEEIVFKFFTDSAERASLISSGDVDVIGDISPIDARSLSGNVSLQILPVIIAGQPTQFIMNAARFPTDNVALRQALILATNRNAIVDSVYQRFSPVAWAPLSVPSAHFNRALIGTYATDTSQAQSLMASLGYFDSNSDGITDIGGIDLEVRTLILTSGQIPDLVSQLQDQWRTIGIRLVAEPVPTLSVLKTRLATGDYNLVALQEFGVDASLLTDFYASDGAEHWTGFSNPELDQLLTQAEQTTVSSSRSEYYYQAQQIIMQNALVLPIRDYVVLNIASNRVQGLKFDAFGWYPILCNVRLLEPVS